MTQSTGELLASALRRALPMIALLVAVGIGGVTLQKRVEGPVYSADTRVLLSTTDIGAIVTGIQPGFVDPRRVMENALSLARSPELYERAARRLESAEPVNLRGITTVTGSDQGDLIRFTVVSSDQELAAEAANAVAAEFPTWRAEVSSAAVRDAVRSLRAELVGAPRSESEALEENLRQLELLETLSSGNAVLVERAESASKISPAPVRDSLLGGSIGLMLALLISGVRQALDTRIRSEAEVEQLLAAPIVASIPSLPKRAKLVTIGRHADRYGDVYALLAAHLMQLRQSSTPLVVAITSATKEEGKSITVSNLAVALAQRGAQVVLADFDLRRPSIARVFELHAGSPGVLQVVRDNLMLERALRKIPLDGSRSDANRRVSANGQARGASMTGSLRVLPAGGSMRDALSHLPGTQQLLTQLSSDADVVLLDTPPALSTTEAADLSSHVDVIFVVARQGKATRRNLRELARQAQSWQTEIAGVIVTDAGTDDVYSYYSG